VLQPVFPSKIQWFAHRLRISAAQTLRLADLPTLGRLGIDVERYEARDYSRTQPIAEAAYFLGFDGLIAPSATGPASISSCSPNGSRPRGSKRSGATSIRSHGMGGESGRGAEGLDRGPKSC